MITSMPSLVDNFSDFPPRFTCAPVFPRFPQDRCIVCFSRPLEAKLTAEGVFKRAIVYQPFILAEKVAFLSALSDCHILWIAGAVIDIRVI